MNPLARTAVRVRLGPDDLDEQNARRCTEELFDLVHLEGYDDLRLDCQDIASISTYALMRLIVLSRCLQEMGGRLRLLNVGPQFRAALYRNRVTSLLEDDDQAADAS